ncbi:MAG TPA: hypothetical protein VHL79_23070 [Ramlibacter sp.]|jgi:hypothetical protein|nr:hypothetical protein [Ramlibacter sp.]
MNSADREPKPGASAQPGEQRETRRQPQRPLDDFEVRRTPSGAMEVVFCGSRYDQDER